MKLLALFAVFSLSSPAALTAPTGSSSTCSATSATPCKCPSGTEYQESATLTIIGAAANDVGALINDFYNTQWFGITLQARGPDNKPGVSVRSAVFPTPIGDYNFVEKLTEYQVRPSGSFVQKFEQLSSTVPLEYQSGNGSFSGYWVTLKGTAIFKYETMVEWSVYGCLTGHPLDFAAFHEYGLNNATEVLKAQGKIQGISTKPFSAQAF